MPETFAQYLEKWLKQSTAQGLNNPLVKMPVKRFRLLELLELEAIANGGSLAIGTMSDPIARNLFRNFKTRIRERGEHCAFICSGSVEIPIAGTLGQQRVALFPVCLKRATLNAGTEQVKVSVSEDHSWQFNPVLEAHLKGFGIQLPEGLANSPNEATNWVNSQLGNRAQVRSDSYVGLFSSQQMVVQARLTEPLLRQSLASNPVVKSKIEGTKVQALDLGEISDEGFEELGLVLPSDDSQLRVVQLTDHGFCLQVEGPPGTGKSQTIANIISNALHRGRNALLVCDKRAAIAQVEERLSDCGLKPALLNLHDEDLDKREFLRQATSKFASGPNPNVYPFNEVRETRKVLNDRVRSGRAISHPSLQISKREALGGMIQLRKTLRNVPNVQIANWQALSKERLTKLLAHLGEWPDLAATLTDSANIWNSVKVESFDDNPNAVNELQETTGSIFEHLKSLDVINEWAASVGVEAGINSESETDYLLAITTNVLARPECHPKLIGNSELGAAELSLLKQTWERRDELRALQHPLRLADACNEDGFREATSLLAVENAISWQDLSDRMALHTARRDEMEQSQAGYLKLCDQIGFVYSPLLKVRRSQLQAVLSLGNLRASIPTTWWTAASTPVLTVAGWKAHLQACASIAEQAPLPCHLLALERLSKTHWTYIEAKAERGFTFIGDVLHFVSYRKCKYALRQVFPTIPPRQFTQWPEVTLHAISALGALQSLRSASEAHATLKQMASAYLAVAHENSNRSKEYLADETVRALEKTAALVEEMRNRNDLFEIDNIHWQTFWEFPNPNLLSTVERMLNSLDSLSFPFETGDNVELALTSHEQARERIEIFLSTYETQKGERKRSIVDSFAAQIEFANCEEKLKPLTKYLDLQENETGEPKWDWLHSIIEWRDDFERLRGRQKLDIDSGFWVKLKDSLLRHQTKMERTYSRLETFFEYSLRGLGDHSLFATMVEEILGGLPLRHVWLEKGRWQKKITAFPEISALWTKILEGSVKPENAQRLFCFNLLRLCDPIAKPHGAEFKQTLKGFAEQDDRLSAWIIEHLIAKLRTSMQKAATAAAQSESELRRLSGLKRIRGTVRELVNSHMDYLLNGKPCWMMSPTSLANLVDSEIFGDYGVPFDLVIFDEASQVRVLDGLLAMAFGKQVIIVGDKNQLSPTDFFAAFVQPDSDTESQDFGVSESLLDEFGGVFEEEKTQVMLMSHYRSETPDLIRFSNDWFYEGRLEVYPPAHIAGIGRRFHYVPDAVYSETAGQRNNPAEAKEVVKLIELHVNEHPEKSLGVVTMNIPQMELIDAELLMFTSEKLRTFCANESLFFLRNLETVQGDEMDRIILSLTYGKNREGRFNAAVLGPLTKSGGDRRLNVAITRSRSGLTIVSSLKAADLQSSTAQSKGFQCLKALLQDVEGIEQARTFGIGSKRFERKNDGLSNIVYCDSPFEEQVVEFLENEGYELECQYGAGKFRLDIVVKERGRNLLAIECDGAAYHSSLVARTRDRARQRLLEELGWRVHRVWSTNWWFFEQQEKEAMIDAINKARGMVSL